MICSLCWIWDLIDSNPSVTASQKLKFHLKTHGMYDTVVSNHVKLISLIASNSKCSVIQYCNVNSFPVSRSNYYGPCKLLTDSVNWPVRHRKLHLSSSLEIEIDTWNDARQALLVARHTQAKIYNLINNCLAVTFQKLALTENESTGNYVLFDTAQRQIEVHHGLLSRSAHKFWLMHGVSLHTVGDQHTH